MGRPKKYATDDERKAAKATRARERRARETKEQQAHRLEEQIGARRRRQETMTEIQRTQALRRNAYCQRLRRLNESDEARAARLLVQQQRLAKESGEERAERQLANALRNRKRRANETMEQQNNRREKDRAGHLARRRRIGTDVNNALDTLSGYIVSRSCEAETT